jgi:hypothetical protein
MGNSPLFRSKSNPKATPGARERERERDERERESRERREERERRPSVRPLCDCAHPKQTKSSATAALI